VIHLHRYQGGYDARVSVWVWMFCTDLVVTVIVRKVP
jgi:hypothetical protein